MQLCTPSKTSNYSGGFSFDRLIDLSFVGRAAPASPEALSYHIKPASQTSHAAQERFIEDLTCVVIGNRNRYQDIDVLVRRVSQSLSRAAADDSAPTWLTQINANDTKVDMRAIAATIESLAMDLKAGPENVDFGRVNRRSPSPQHLVAALRTSFVFRRRVRGWYDLRDFAKSYLDAQQIDAARMLKGLTGE